MTTSRRTAWVLFLASLAAFSAALLVSHLLGPLTAWLLGDQAPNPLWSPLLIGVALVITGAPCSWLMARAFELPARTAGWAVGGLGTLLIWTPLIASGGLDALGEAPWAFSLRLCLAIVAGAVARRWANLGLPPGARNPYAAAMDETRLRVVIVGGGFGGLSAAHALAGAPLRVTLVDARNHHLFQPLLYQVATAALPATAIASPLRRVLRDQANAEVLMARAVGIDLAAKKLKLAFGEGGRPGEATAPGELSYDRLIVATGSTDSYFGHPEWAEPAPGLKSLDQALEIRNRILRAYEAAERETDAVARAAWLTFAVVGGGPTGVELAGALSEIARETLEKDFRHIQAAAARVVLIEAGPRLLPSFEAKLSASAQRSLQKLGVEVLLSTRVVAIAAAQVKLEAGAHEVSLQARTVLWAAGVRASPFGAQLQTALDSAGRVKVEPDLTLPGHSEVFVIGDLASLAEGGKQVPGLAPAALQQGRHAAKNLLLQLKNKPTEPFRYRDKGSLATIGRGRAVGQVGQLRFSGLLAWVVWVFVHILYLVGFRNRYLVLTEWAFSYVFHDRGARLIAGREEIEVGPPAAGPGAPAA